MLALNSRIVFLLLLMSIVTYLIVYTESIDKGEPLTEFYVLSAEGKAEGYPLNISTGEIGAVTIGVINCEFKDVEYLLVVGLTQVTFFAGVNEIDLHYNVQTVQKKSIILKDSEKWEERFNFTFNNPGKHKVEFLLYNDGEEPYRRLHLWVDVRD